MPKIILNCFNSKMLDSYLDQSINDIVILHFYNDECKNKILNKLDSMPKNNFYIKYISIHTDYNEDIIKRFNINLNCLPFNLLYYNSVFIYCDDINEIYKTLANITC
jgi:hypothetical protein